MDQKLKRYLIIGIIILLVAAGLIAAWRVAGTQPAKYDAFAKCLKDKGALFYGAFWCPHCQAQKKLFGSSVQYLPYVECSTPDGNDQLQACKDAKVNAYPTWKFSDGAVQEGEMSLHDLAAKTGCQLPN